MADREGEKIEERLEKRKLVDKAAIDLETAVDVAEKNKTRFFGKRGFLKSKREEIECESVHLFFEPFVVAKANYLLDYYKKKTYRVKVDDEVSEAVLDRHASGIVHRL